MNSRRSFFFKKKKMVVAVYTVFDVVIDRRAGVYSSVERAELVYIPTSEVMKPAAAQRAHESVVF